MVGFKDNYYQSGMDWVKRMEVLKKVPKQSYTKKELEGIIEIYG